MKFIRDVIDFFQKAVKMFVILFFQNLFVFHSTIQNWHIINVFAALRHAKRIIIMNKNLHFIFIFYFKHDIAKMLDARETNETKKIKKKLKKQN